MFVWMERMSKNEVNKRRDQRPTISRENEAKL